MRPYTNPGTDLDVYFDYVRRAASGAVPYADFSVEYPPAAWFVIRAPATTDWVTYVQRFAWIATAFEIAAFGLLMLIARRVSPRHFWLVAATYVITTTLLREFLPTRLDSGLLFLLMLWAWLTLVAADRATGGLRALSYGVLGYATSFKVAPALIVPFALVHDWKEVRGIERWVLVLSFVVGLAVPFMLLWPTAGAASGSFLTYHINRGLEIESVWATILWPMRWLGSPLSTAHVEHAIELTGPWTALMALVSAAVSVAAWGSCLSAERVRSWPGSAIVAGTIGLAVFVSLSKVLSPQYFVWMLPLLLIAGTETFSSDRALSWWCAGLIGVAALTALIYPRFFLSVVEMRPLGFLLVLARNLLLIALLAALSLHVWKR